MRIRSTLLALVTLLALTIAGSAPSLIAAPDFCAKRLDHPRCVATAPTPTPTPTTPPSPTPTPVAAGANLADYGGNWATAIEASKTRGKLLIVPAGTWPAPRIFPYAGLTIRGDGRAVSIVTRTAKGAHAVGGFFHVTTANVTISDLTIKGWPIAAGTSDDILVNGIDATGLRILRVDLVDAQGIGIQLEGALMSGALVEDVSITNTTFRDNGYHGVALWPYNGTHDSTFRRIAIDGADYAGIFCDAGTTVGTAAGVDDNTFEDIVIRHAARKALPAGAGIGAGWMLTGAKGNTATGWEITDQTLGAAMAFGYDQSGLPSTDNVMTGGKIGRTPQTVTYATGLQSQNTVEWGPA